MSGNGKGQGKQALRVLRFIQQVRFARLQPFDEPALAAGHGADPATKILLTAKAGHNDGPARQMLTTRAMLDRLAASDLLQLDDTTCWLTRSGSSHLKRQRHSAPQENPFGEQHRQTVVDTALVHGERQSVRRNLNESPLSRLAALRAKDGSPWLCDAAFNAGERLRQDFTRAQLLPSVTSNWNAAMGGAHKAQGQGGKADLSDSALDARQRFNQALSFVGPDLSDVLIDVCCYLKGLQVVERERGWPQRSAKLMLRVGLGLLAQHYGTRPGRMASPEPMPEKRSHPGL